MCTPGCQSAYGDDFAYLRGLVIIPKDNRTYQDLLTKQNLRCVREFLADIQSKVR